MGFVVYSAWTSRTVRVHREGCASLKKLSIPNGNDEGRHKTPRQQHAVKWADAEGLAKAECKRVGASAVSHCGLCMPSP